MGIRVLIKIGPPWGWFLPRPRSPAEDPLLSPKLKLRGTCKGPSTDTVEPQPHTRRGFHPCVDVGKNTAASQPSAMHIPCNFRPPPACKALSGVDKGGGTSCTVPTSGIGPEHPDLIFVAASSSQRVERAPELGPAPETPDQRLTRPDGGGVSLRIGQSRCAKATGPDPK